MAFTYRQWRWRWRWHCALMAAVAPRSARIHGTVPWPGVVRERIGIKVAADIVADIQEQLAPVNKALPRLAFKGCSAMFLWMNCRSSGPGQWRRSTRALQPGPQLAGREHQEARPGAWRACGGEKSSKGHQSEPMDRAGKGRLFGVWPVAYPRRCSPSTK